MSFCYKHSTSFPSHVSKLHHHEASPLSEIGYEADRDGNVIHVVGLASGKDRALRIAEAIERAANETSCDYGVICKTIGTDVIHLVHSSTLSGSSTYSLNTIVLAFFIAVEMMIIL